MDGWMEGGDNSGKGDWRVTTDSGDERGQGQQRDELPMNNEASKRNVKSTVGFRDSLPFFFFFVPNFFPFPVVHFPDSLGEAGIGMFESGGYWSDTGGFRNAVAARAQLRNSQAA